MMTSSPVVRIGHDAKASEPLLLEAGTRELLVDERASATVIEHPGSGAMRIQLAANARLTHVRLFLQTSGESIQTELSVAQDRSSTYESHVFQMGEADVVHRLETRLEGDGAACTLNGLYLAHQRQRIENRTRIDHQFARGTSREFYKGILDGEARTLFDGLVIVGAQAQKTDSAQTNKNLLLSPRAHAQSTPELKILANDVKCRHGATIGQLDPAQVFYMRSRGLPEPEARRLLVLAFANEMIEQLDSASLRDTLHQALMRKFGA